MNYLLKLNKYEKLVKSDKFTNHNEELYVVYGLETVLESEFVETTQPKFTYTAYNNVVEKKSTGYMKHKMQFEPVMMIRHKDGALKIRKRYEELVYKNIGNVFNTNYIELSTEPSLKDSDFDWKTLETTYTK